MILVDSARGSNELKPLIIRCGISCDITSLDELGDACFEGNGPRGTIAVGVERKRLHDMLHCIDDARYNRQRIDMSHLYGKSFLMLEGYWKSHENGTLMEGYPQLVKVEGKWKEVVSWAECRYRSRSTLYSKLYNYLVSVSMSGVHVSYSRDIEHTALNIVSLYKWFRKKWQDHTSLIEPQKLAIPTMNYRPSLAHKWAYDLEGIGAKRSAIAGKQFKTGWALAHADEGEWLRIPGIGVKTARDIYKEIRGYK